MPRHTYAAVVAFAAATIGGVLPVNAQSTARSLKTEINVKSEPLFEGEAVYVQVSIRNTSPITQESPARGTLQRAAVVSIRDDRGVDTRRLTATIDFFGEEPRDTIPAGGSIAWTIPVHWFWGSNQEPAEALTYYAFRPGRYSMTVSFPTLSGIAGDSTVLQVRARTAAEDRARVAFLAAESRLRREVSRSTDRAAGLATLRAVIRDPVMAPYLAQMFCDVASAVRGFAARYSPLYEPTVDSLRTRLLLERSGPEQLRLIQHLSPAAVESLESQNLLPGSAFVAQRLREIRHETRRN